jgi:hypothetical protein
MAGARKGRSPANRPVVAPRTPDEWERGWQPRPGRALA